MRTFLLPHVLSVFMLAANVFAQSVPNEASTLSESSAAVTTAGLLFVPITPCRLVDTRYGNGAYGPPLLSGGATRSFSVSGGSCGIPASAQAFAINVTVVPKAALTYLAVWPAGQAQPAVSTLNSDGRIKANAAVIPAGANGSISVYASDSTELIIDVNGYFVGGGGAGLAFYSLVPCRIADTRNAPGPYGGPAIPASGTRTFPVSSSACGVPANAQAYSLNLTAIPAKTLNYVTAWPAGQPQPGSSSLNAPTGAITANAALMSAGSSGQLSVYASDATDLVIDINGYFAPLTSGGLGFYPVQPECRDYDSRGPGGDLLITGAYLFVEFTNVCGTPASAQAYVLNVTAIPYGPLTYLTLWPNGETRPNISTLNALDGVIASNMAIVPAINNGIEIISVGDTNLILDMFGYFAP